jgi:plastocyanin
LTVNPGDEVRWVNKRTQSIEIDLLETRIRELTCNRGFTDVCGGPRENVILVANGTASACFPIAGMIRYNVRMESALPGGKKIVSGVVKVRS